jgi:hypothetical protein
VESLCTVPSVALIVGLGVVCDSNNLATDPPSGVCRTVYAVIDPFAQAVSVERVEADHVSRPGVGVNIPSR